MTTFPQMGLTLPTRGAPGSGAWGDTEDANWAKVDAHDHTSGKGSPITTAAISINADLPFSALYAPTQLHRVQWSTIAAGGLTAGQRLSLFVSDGTSGLVANELYWFNNAGNKVQITAGNALNFSAFVGGIGGDYTSVGAQLNYVDGQKAYEFHEGTVDSNKWARLRTGDVRLFPFNTNGSVFVGMAAPGAIAGSYTVTWPLALPGASNLVAIDNTGQVAFSNTISQAVSFSATATVGTGLTVSAGGAAITGNSTVTGNLQITGTLTYGDTETYPAGLGIAGTGATGPTSGSSGAGLEITLGTSTSGGAGLPLRLRTGVTITAWQVRIIKNTGAVTVSAKLWKANQGTGTQIGSTQSNSAATPGLITLGQSGLSEVVPSSNSYYIEVVGSGSSGDIVIDYQVTTA